MKLQNMAIIFAIIIIPISLIMSKYVQCQVDALVIQTSYNTKLVEATRDAVSAFQSNSLNSTRESYAFSTRRHVLAAAKTFSNSLATSLGISGYGSEELDPYIPALLFTMYDGYYIYTPQETVDLDGNKVYKHDLKSYVYYSVRYKNGTTDVVINYSLDNYIAVCGKVNGEYVSKSGYLITGNITEGKESNLTEDLKFLTYDKDYNGELSPSEFRITLEDLKEKDPDVYNKISAGITRDNTFTPNALQYVRGKYQYYMVTASYVYDDNGEKIYNVIGKNDYYRYDQDGKLMKLANGEAIFNGGEDYSAKKFYDEAKVFTVWVNENLKNLTVADMCTVNGTRLGDLTDENEKKTYSDFNLADSSKIFEIRDANDPEKDESTFCQHKRKLMRFLIENDLASSIAAYNGRLGNGNEYKMPKISEEEWDKLLKNVSLMSFLEGVPAGNKIYNNYAIVTSTMNKKTVSRDTMYYVDENNVYHLEGCTHATGKVTGYKKADFFRYTYYNSTYQYMKHNERACYYCVVGRSQETKINNTLTAQETQELEENYKSAYLKAIGREKYNLYKSTTQLNLTNEE